MQGTTLVTGDDHSLNHRQLGSIVNQLSTVFGTTPGTNLFGAYVAGNFPLRVNSSNIPQAILGGGTLNNGVFGSQTAQGGTFQAPTINGLGTAAGTMINGVYNNPTLGTPSIQNGTATLGFTLKDNGSIIQSGTADHITLIPGASKLVRTSVLQQNGTTNSYVNNAVLQNGWTWVAGANGTITSFTQAITFGVNFTAAPVVTIGQLGAKVGSDPTAITDGTQTGSSLAAYLVQVTGLGTTGFTMNVLFLNPPGNGARPLFTWQAVGPI